MTPASAIHPHADEHARRRARLCGEVDGPILLIGNGARARNLPMTHLPFRQDSTFLYFTGCSIPNAALLLEDGEAVLFLPEPAPDDALWHGEVASFEQLRKYFGVQAVAAASTLPSIAQSRANRIKTLAVADEQRNVWLSELTGRPLGFGTAHGHGGLVDAVIAMRRSKSAVELQLLREAARHSADAHRAVAASLAHGVHERALAALFEAVLAARGCVLGYPTILTQRGEVLHNFSYVEPLRPGALLLVDGGGEIEAGYGCDITRTWPVSGRFTPRQRAVYEAVLEAQLTAIELCRPGVRFREVHDAACLVLAGFLKDEGLLTVGPHEAVERGAHALFFPHGVGHLLGLDVHDLENFGDLPAYPRGQARPDQFGTCYLRLDLPLEPGWVVTVEPGFYVVPAILNDEALRARFSGVVDFERASSWAGFGGIRLEDDVAVTEGAPDILTAAVPKGVDEVEQCVGQGVSLDVLLQSASPMTR